MLAAKPDLSVASAAMGAQERRKEVSLEPGKIGEDPHAGGMPAAAHHAGNRRRRDLAACRRRA